MFALFSSSFIPYTTSLILESNFADKYISIAYGLLTIFISFNLLIIQMTAEKCNKEILGVGKQSKILPNREIMTIDIFIKLVGTLISVFLWPPFILIAVLISFEYNSLASRIAQKRIKKQLQQNAQKIDKNKKAVN